MKLVFSCFLLAIVFLSPSHCLAHAIGQPPYFKVNGIFTDYYNVPTTSLSDFILPEDIAVGTFLVNEEISFEIDTEALPLPDQVIEETKFLWDFGDGTSRGGLNNKHTYTKPGTYFVGIKADSGQGFEPQILQSTAINILPDRSYVLPKAIIEVNNQGIEDPLLDIIDVNFKKEIYFDASKTSKGSSEISEYFWDLGDQTSRVGANFKYAYSENPYTVFPVLRVKTTDGFISDAFIQIKDEAAFDDSFNSKITNLDWRFLVAAVVISILVAGILTWIISKFWLKRK